jgi:uncharacterized protein YecT (DUF1311 family)
MRDLAAVFLACVLSASVASAEECGDSATQKDLNQCSFEKLQRSEQELTEISKTIRERLSDNPAAIVSLDLAAQAWNLYRDADCLFLSSGTLGGSSYPMNLNNCKEELTHARAEQLTKLLKCPEGDLTCPVPHR